MDPVPLANAEWTEIGKLLTSMWCLVGFVVLLAANMLAGHIFIPSLVASEHVPSSMQKARPIFYGFAVLALGGAMFELYQVRDLSDVIQRFWDDPWI